MLPLKPYISEVGPFKALLTGNSGTFPYVVYRKIVTGFRQKKPYNIDTAYKMVEYCLISGQTDAGTWGWLPANLVSRVDASNRARKKFVGALGDTSSFGATLTAELKETWNTVVGGITRLYSAARAVKKLRFAEAASLLGLPYKEVLKRHWRTRTYYVSRRNGLGRMRVRQRVAVYKTEMDWGTGRTHVKSLASGWLMWSYGVKPLAQDIQNGMEVLTRELPMKQIIGRGTASWDQRANYSSWVTVRRAKSHCKVSAYVGVVNPNTWLANQLGLVNPAQWAMEAVPFSFVLDWVSNLSDVISQMTDFVGLQLSRPLTVYKDVGWEQQQPSQLGIDSYQKRVTQFERQLSVPPARLLWAYERFEWQRGLNAISLLVGFIGAKAPK